VSVLARFAAVTLLSAAVASAQAPREGAELRWDDGWSRVHPAAYTAASLGVATVLILDQLVPYPEEGNWIGGILFDRAITAAISPDDEALREDVARASDLMLLGSVLHPLIDAWVVAGFIRGSSDVAWQLTAITYETLAIAYVLNTLVKRVVARERPHGADCTRDDRVLRPGRCGGEGRLRSFYSGHATGTATMAGLVCTVHANLPLYGSQAADALGCGLAVLNAAAVAVMRIVARRHWSTDVLIGAAVGAAVGILVPQLLHFGLAPPETGSTSSPLLAPVPGTVSFPVASGSF
jgi:membrane-associated phospholipid phosphatase